MDSHDASVARYLFPVCVVCVFARAGRCVCARARKRERESVCVCVCVSESERERERVYVCVCVCLTVLCVCVCGCVGVCLCVCVCACILCLSLCVCVFVFVCVCVCETFVSGPKYQWVDDVKLLMTSNFLVNFFYSHNSYYSRIVWVCVGVIFIFIIKKFYNKK